MREKTFNLYFNKLIAYCELMNVKLYTSDKLEDYCMLDKREIVISTNYGKTQQIAATLHEIGHFIDYSHNKKIFSKQKAYNALVKNNHELTYYERKQLILLETRAWEYAQSLANMLNIKIELDTIKRSCLSSYYAIRVKQTRKIHGDHK